MNTKLGIPNAELCAELFSVTVEINLSQLNICIAKTLTLRALESGFYNIYLEIDISETNLQASNEANDAVAANNFHCQQ
jgi:hypothetical protein